MIEYIQKHFLVRFVLVVGVLYLGYKFVKTSLPETCTTKVVTEFGACAETGHCATRFSDGSEEVMRLPIVGKKVKECSLF